MKHHAAADRIWLPHRLTRGDGNRDLKPNGVTLPFLPVTKCCEVQWLQRLSARTCMSQSTGCAFLRSHGQRGDRFCCSGLASPIPSVQLRWTVPPHRSLPTYVLPQTLFSREPKLSYTNTALYILLSLGEAQKTDRRNQSCPQQPYNLTGEAGHLHK